MINSKHSPIYSINSEVALPLDGVNLTEVVYAWAFIQLLSGYSGPLIRVRVGTGGGAVFTDVYGTVVNGVRMVTVADLTVLGSDVFQTTIYDQSGSGPDATNAVEASQLILIRAGVGYASSTGVVSAITTDSILHLTSASFTMPKNFTSIDGYLNPAGGNLEAKTGTNTVGNTNGFFNLGYNNGTDDVLARAHSSGGGTIGTRSLPDLVDTTKVTHSALYMDDDNGDIFLRGAEADASLVVTSGQRTGVTSKQVYFNRLLSFTTKENGQLYAILFNTSLDEDRIDVETSLQAILG